MKEVRKTREKASDCKVEGSVRKRVKSRSRNVCFERQCEKGWCVLYYYLTGLKSKH